MNIAAAQYPRLKQLWNSGMSAVECGQELGLAGEQSEIREAVLRAIEEGARPTAKRAAGVTGRRPGVQVERSNLPKGHRTPPKVEPDPMFAVDGVTGEPDVLDLEIPVERRRSLLGPPHNQYPERRSGECGWPVGEPKDPAFFFCGAASYGDEPYCAHHCRRAYHGHLSRKRAA